MLLPRNKTSTKAEENNQTAPCTGLERSADGGERPEACVSGACLWPVAPPSGRSL